MKKPLIISGAILVLLLLDQLSKYLAQQYLSTPYQIIPDFFELEYSENTGIAFGIAISYPFLLILNFVVLAIIVYVLVQEFKFDKKISQLAMSLVVAGAVGNLIDRFAQGFVVDFIAVWRWPNFNFADIYISVGILLMIVFYGNITQEKQGGTMSKK